ncbi:hypothetical protein EVA_04918 [gut metagenome]|uniref:Uncharacterized protein n=1 Tax=gut metagenome TaxID=749906 RepID=J9H0V4_9ZZZZ
MLLDNEYVRFVSPELIRLLPAVPMLKRIFKLDNHCCVADMKGSSESLHAKAADGKKPHWFPLANLLDPSALAVTVNRYLSLSV